MHPSTSAPVTTQKPRFDRAWGGRVRLHSSLTAMSSIGIAQSNADVVVGYGDSAWARA